MPDELATPWEFHAGVTELRDSLGFTVRHVAESGEPCIVSRYGKPQVAIVPLAEWRRFESMMDRPAIIVDRNDKRESPPQRSGNRQS